MARVPTKGTSCERLLFEALAGQPLPGPVENAPGDVLGKPDLVIRRGHDGQPLAVPLAVFVDGCYWHGCPTHYKAPRTRAGAWRVKLERNQIRDRGIGARCLHCGCPTGILPERGWAVVRFWECEVKANAAACAKVVVEAAGRNHGKPIKG